MTPASTRFSVANAGNLRASASTASRGVTVKWLSNSFHASTSAGSGVSLSGADAIITFTKEMNLGRGLNVQVSAEIFNMLNDGTTIVGTQINGRNGDIRRFGRRWQLGMKMAF